jgi:hypothetical protein
MVMTAQSCTMTSETNLAGNARTADEKRNLAGGDFSREWNVRRKVEE